MLEKILNTNYLILIGQKFFNYPCFSYFKTVAIDLFIQFKLIIFFLDFFRYCNN